MERIQASDAAIMAQLQRWLHTELYGDEQGNQGLYWQIVHSVSTMERYYQLKGQIEALKAVQMQIQHIANSLGTGMEETVVFSRSGMN